MLGSSCCKFRVNDESFMKFGGFKNGEINLYLKSIIEEDLGWFNEF